MSQISSQFFKEGSGYLGIVLDVTTCSDNLFGLDALKIAA